MPKSIFLDPLLTKLITSLHNSPELLKSSQLEEKINAFYSGEKPIYYTGNKDSEQELKEFIGSPHYQQLKLQFKKIEESIKHFTLEHALTVRGSSTAFDSLEPYFKDLFKESLKRDQEGNIIDNNRFGKNRSYLFGEGKQYLEEIAILVHDETISLAARQNAIIILLEDEGLMACAAGCFLRLQTSAQSLKYNLDSTIPKQMAQFIIGSADEAMLKSYGKSEESPLQGLLNHVSVQFRLGDRIIGVSIHVKRFLINRLVEELQWPLTFLSIKDASPFYQSLDNLYNTHEGFKVEANHFFGEYVANFKKLVTASAWIEATISDILALVTEKTNQESLNFMERQDFIQARLQALGEDAHFSWKELYSNGDYQFLSKDSLKITILERLFNAGWLQVDLTSDNDLKQETSYWYQHNINWRDAQNYDELPFNPRPDDGRYHIIFSNIGLSWIKIENEEGDEQRCLFLDLLKEENGLQTLQKALSDQNVDPNNSDMLNSLMQTPDDLNRFLSEIPDHQQRLSALKWLEPLLTMGSGNKNNKIDWPFSDNGLIAFLEDEKTRFLFLLANREKSDFLTEKVKYCLRQGTGYKGSLEGIEFLPLENKKVYLSDIFFAEVDLSKALFKTQVEKCQFGMPGVANLDLVEAIFEQEVGASQFTEKTLKAVHFKSVVKSCNFINTELENVHFLGEVNENTLFSDAQLTEVKFEKMVDNCGFGGTILDKVFFSNGVKNSAFNPADANEENDDDENFEFESTSLNEVVFAGKLENSQFYRADLTNVQFKIVENGRFDNAKLERVTFKAEVNKCEFHTATFRNVIFETEVSESVFNKADLSEEMIIFESKVKHCDFSNANLKDAYFRSEVSNSIFTGADLSEADITFESTVQHCDFTDAELQEVCFEGEVLNNKFQNSNLEKAKFEENISKSSFKGAGLSETTFSAEVNQCDFTEAALMGTVFEGKIIDSDFNGVDLSETVFHPGIEIINCNFNEAKLPEGFILPALSESESSLLNLDVCSSEGLNRSKREISNECFFSQEEVQSLLDKEGKIENERLFFFLDKKGFSEGKVSDTQRDQFLNWAKSEKIINLDVDLEKIDSSVQFHAFNRRFKFLNGLSSFGKGASFLTSGLIATDMLTELKRGDYKDLAINLSVMRIAAFSNELAEKGLQLGIRFVAEGKVLVGNLFKIGASLSSRGPNTAFISYDLVRQVLHLKAGDREALVPVIGDSVMLGIDATEATIQALQSIGLLAEEVSAVTGPLGEGITAIIMVGTKIYSAIKEVKRIESVVDLTPEERLDEGWRAFMGDRPKPDIQEAMQEAEILQSYVKNNYDYLQRFNNKTMAYFFPALDFGVKSEQVRGRLLVRHKPTSIVHVSSKETANNQIEFNPGSWKVKDITKALEIIEHCKKTGRGPNRKMCKVSDGIVYEKNWGQVLYHRVTPEISAQGFVVRVNGNLQSINHMPAEDIKHLFCLPLSDNDKSVEVYLPKPLTWTRCTNMLGFWNPNYVKSRYAPGVIVSFESGNDQLTIQRGMEAFNFILNLGAGNKTINSLTNSGNITLILEGKSETTGSFLGSETGYHTLVLGGVLPGKIYLAGSNSSIHYHASDQRFLFNKIDKVIGAENGSDEIIVNNNDQKGLLLIDTQGGYSENNFDWVHLTGDQPTQQQVVVVLDKHTGVINTATHGSFVYQLSSSDSSTLPIGQDKAKIKILKPGAEHFIQFNHLLSDIVEITINHDQQTGLSTCQFVPFQLDLTTLIECRTDWLPELQISFADESYLVLNKDNYHAVQRISRLDIEEAIQESIEIAQRFSITVMTHLPEREEVILVSAQEQAHILPSSPEAKKTYLVAANARENSYVIMPSRRNQTTTVQTEIRRFTPTDFIDRLDFDELTRFYVEKYPELKSDNFWIQFEPNQVDLEVILRADQNTPQRLEEFDQSTKFASVLLKEGINWYTQLQIKLLDIPRKIIATACSRHDGRSGLDVCDYGVQALPLTFGSEKKFIVINPDDVLENNEIIVEKAMQPLFYRDGDDLIASDAIQACHPKMPTWGFNTTLNKTVIIFGSYFTVDKMQTLVLHTKSERFSLKDLADTVLPWQATLDCHQTNLNNEILFDQTTHRKRRSVIEENTASNAAPNRGGVIQSMVNTLNGFWGTYRRQSTPELHGQENPKESHSSLPVNYEGTLFGNVCLVRSLAHFFTPSVAKKMKKMERVLSQAENTSDLDWAFNHLQDGIYSIGNP